MCFMESATAFLLSKMPLHFETSPSPTFETSPSTICVTCLFGNAIQVPRPLLTTFHHDRCRAHKLLVGHRPVAIFRTAIWLLSGVTRSSSLGTSFAGDMATGPKACLCVRGPLPNTCWLPVTIEIPIKSVLLYRYC